MDITLITPTGGRPETLRRCFEYVRRFAWDGLIQWILVDDGVPHSVEQSISSRIWITVLHPTPAWKPGDNTLARNLLVALGQVAYDAVAFVEDDDWYAPEYLLQASERLRYNGLVGEKNAHYYHVPSQSYRVMPNIHYASLSQTAVRREYLPVLSEICRESSKFIDVRLWERIPDRKLYPTALCVGLKGLPGRPGIGIGHHPQSGDGWGADPELSVLRSWIGKDIKLYQEYIR